MALTKCINSESKQYKPVLTDKLILDDVPTVNSLNAITSDAVARAVAGASGEVPAVTENDNGKVLKAVYDAGGPAVEWGEAGSGLPESSSADEGKVLTVDAQGEPQWQTAQGGSSYTAGDGIDIDNDNKITVKSQPMQFVSGPSFDYQPTYRYDFSDPAYLYTSAVQVKVNSLQISSSYCYGKLVLVLSQDLRSYISINATGISQSTGWTVLAFDSTDPANNYAYASESYDYVSGSGNQMNIAEAYNPKDKYYVFTFSTSNAHGTISGNPCICLVPKPNEGFTGTSPWGVPTASISTTGVYTNSGQWVGVPTSGSGIVDKTYLNLQYALPKFNKISDAGKVLQVQNDGTLAWVTLS